MYKYIARQRATELEVIKLISTNRRKILQFYFYLPFVHYDILAAIILKRFTPLVCRRFPIRNRKCWPVHFTNPQNQIWLKVKRMKYLSVWERPEEANQKKTPKQTKTKCPTNKPQPQWGIAFTLKSYVKFSKLYTIFLSNSVTFCQSASLVYTFQRTFSSLCSTV